MGAALLPANGAGRSQNGCRHLPIGFSGKVISSPEGLVLAPRDFQKAYIVIWKRVLVFGVITFEIPIIFFRACRSIRICCIPIFLGDIFAQRWDTSLKFLRARHPVRTGLLLLLGAALCHTLPVLNPALLSLTFFKCCGSFQTEWLFEGHGGIF